MKHIEDGFTLHTCVCQPHHLQTCRFGYQAKAEAARMLKEQRRVSFVATCEDTCRTNTQMTAYYLFTLLYEQAEAEVEREREEKE